MEELSEFTEFTLAYSTTPVANSDDESWVGVLRTIVKDLVSSSYHAADLDPVSALKTQVTLMSYQFV